MKVAALSLACLAASAALALASGPVAAPTMAVFGIKIHAPLSIPTCPRETWDVKRLCADTAKATETVYGGKEMMAYFPVMNSPPYMDGFAFFIQTVDGLVEGVEFATWGPRDQASVIRELKNKYGEPTLGWANKIKNARGEAAEAAHALWKFSDLTVGFDGWDGKTNDGQVRIRTPKLANMIYLSEEKQKARVPKL